jgi:hypothetical protein
LDPVKSTRSILNIPLRNESDRKLLRTWSSQTVAAPSPYWGNEIVWNDPVNPSGPHMDSKGRVWVHVQTRADMPDYCKAGSNNPFAKNFPMPAALVPRGVVNYDPKTGKFEMIDRCFPSGHMIFGNDKDETLYYDNTSGIGSERTGGIGWIKTRVWDATHDAEKSQGWCPAVIDYNGDGKTGAYTKGNEPPDPKLDRVVDGASRYGIAFNRVDGSVWYAGGVALSKTAVPGRLIRMVPGDNPPATCKTEVYEPPFDNPKRPGVEAYSPLGIGIDAHGVVWTALARRKCTGPLNGPTATGQHCPEKWTLYPVPGPKFKGTDVLADSFYHSWVDDFNTLGLGNNVPIVNGTGSDSLIAFLPETKKFITMERVIWHVEGGKGTPTFVAHFQVRPDPLAK